MKAKVEKERQNQFFIYLVVFSLTAMSFIAALFFTQETNPNSINMQDDEQFISYADFENTQPKLIKLIDTVINNNVENLNSNWSVSTIQSADYMINDYIENRTKSDFEQRLIELLKLYVNTQGQIIEYTNKKDKLSVALKECEDNKKSIEFINKINKPAQ